jgi:hypothetical protein
VTLVFGVVAMDAKLRNKDQGGAGDQAQYSCGPHAGVRPPRTGNPSVAGSRREVIFEMPGGFDNRGDRHSRENGALGAL